ncbi:c-type cytochrome [Azonexus sp.]|uniref:c-type cytochrome n=1 Tax=Azonexus sp. TaxID=1872668 RepID=UPI0039E2D2EB
MRRKALWRWRVQSALALAGALLMLFQATAEASEAAAVPSLERQKQLVHMVRQECGSCHGMSLQGGLGPALLPADLQDKSSEGLAATVYHGRPGTPMPPWQRFLNENEAAWIIERLLAGFPE